MKREALAATFFLFSIYYRDEISISYIKEKQIFHFKVTIIAWWFEKNERIFFEERNWILDEVMSQKRVREAVKAELMMKQNFPQGWIVKKRRMKARWHNYWEMRIYLVTIFIARVVWKRKKTFIRDYWWWLNLWSCNYQLNYFNIFFSILSPYFYVVAANIYRPFRFGVAFLFSNKKMLFAHFQMFLIWI